MATTGLTIQNYLQPGAYSTIIPNPTTATASGTPIVAIVGQGLYGSYTPTLFFNSSDAQTMYGIASKANPLSLGIQFAFLNGASQVLGLNVQPDNSTPAGLVISLSNLPVSAYGAAPSNATDAVTQQPINTSGNVAGTFYIQDFNPGVSDPLYSTDAQSVQLAYAFAGNTSMLQYEKALGATIVPLQNTAQQQITVYTVEVTSPPTTPTGDTNANLTQAQWNQFQNAVALMNAFNGAYLSPVLAQILIPDTTGPITVNNTNYRDIYSSIGVTVNEGSSTATPVNIVDFYTAYTYALNHGGILYLSALTAGTGHQIIIGLFDSNSASPTSQVNPQALGFPTAVNLGSTNPYVVFANGGDGVITDQSYINALEQLQNVRADMVVVLNTSVAVQQALKLHVTTMSSYYNRNERIGLTSGPISESTDTTVQNAVALQGGPGAQRMVYIWPTAGFYFDSVLNTTVAVDGTYLAAACAGILAGGDQATPLTHKLLSGFSDVSYHLADTQENAIAQYGVCIIENNPNYGLRIRDGITCDPTSPETQEISVVRQLDYAAQSLRDIMDANIVATKITRNTLAVVTQLAQQTLQSLEDSNLIYGYKNLAARIDPNDPRQIDLAVTIRPSYPCKYVVITISVTSALDGLS
jgi:hypothetical protein